MRLTVDSAVRGVANGAPATDWIAFRWKSTTADAK
jgi:hypothetical protein